MEATAQDVSLPPPSKQRRLTSNVWKYFRINENDESKAVCQLCPSRTLISRGSRQRSKPFYTRCLWKHLENKHVFEYKNIKTMSRKDDSDFHSRIRRKLDELRSRQTPDVFGREMVGDRERPTDSLRKHQNPSPPPPPQTTAQQIESEDQQLESQQSSSRAARQFGSEYRRRQIELHSSQTTPQIGPEYCRRQIGSHPLQSGIGGQQIGPENRQIETHPLQTGVQQIEPENRRRHTLQTDNSGPENLRFEHRPPLSPRIGQQDQTATTTINTTGLSSSSSSSLPSTLSPPSSLPSTLSLPSPLTLPSSLTPPSSLPPPSTPPPPDRLSAATRHEEDRVVARKIGEMLATDGHGFSFVENPGFVALVEHLLPSYRIPSKEHFENVVIFDLYHLVQEKVSQILSSVNWISLTVDVLRQGYHHHIAVAGHWLTEDFEKMTAVLHSKTFFQGIHPSESEIDVGEVLDSWNVPKDVVHVVMRDGATSRGWEDWPSTQETCFLNRLQTIVDEFVFQVNGVAANVRQARSVVDHFSSAAEKLTALQREMGLPVETLFSDDSFGRHWISTCEMFRQLVRQRQAVETYYRTENVSAAAPLDWPLVENLLAILQPFEEIVRHHATRLSDVIPAVTLLCTFLTEMSVPDPDMETLKTNLIGVLEKQFHGKENSIEEKEWYILATVLDPRYKLDFFMTDLLPVLVNVLQKGPSSTAFRDDAFKDSANAAAAFKDSTTFKDSTNTADSAASTNIATFKGLTNTAAFKDSSNTATFKDSAASKDSSNAVLNNVAGDKNVGAEKRVVRSLWDCYSEIVQKGKSERKDVEYSREMNEYLNSDVVPRNVCPLVWWRTNRNKYPSLAALARKYLSVPASCLPPHVRHCRMHERVEYCQMPISSDKLLFLHYNLSLL